MNDCIFCRIVDGRIPSEKLFENDRVLAILDINPVAPGHALVLTKAHHELVTDLPADLLAEWIARTQEIARAVVKAASAEGFNLLSNNHKCSGQAIPHVHFHVIPRRTGDGIKFAWVPVKYPEGEMGAWAEKIRKAMG
ncbi:MAG: HIT family protein [Planctomycetes bacterium]|nr:HIT family protein [Planctomycetota bacterium]